MAYNLTDKQKNLLRWIVTAVRNSSLEEEFMVVWVHGGGHIENYRGERPELTSGSLDALQSSGMLLCAVRHQGSSSGRSYESSRTVTLLGEAYRAVDSDFATPDRSFADFMPPNVQLSYLDEELKTRCIPLLGAGGSNPIVWDSVVRTAGTVVLEERLRSAAGGSDSATGADLVNAAFKKAGSLGHKFGSDSEREAYRSLYAGAVGLVRNDYAHHLVDPAPEDGAAVLLLVNLLLKMLDGLAQ